MQHDARMDLAHQVIETFQKHPQVRHVFLRGSLADGQADQYSDIDIGVDVSGSDNGQFLLHVPAFLQQHFQLAFYDWVPSLLPNAYVVNLYFQNTPLFWNVDIQCLATPHVPSLTNITLDPLNHFLKLWILHAKYALRGQPQNDVDRLYRRVLHKDDVEGKRFDELMEEILEELKRMADLARHPFIAKCEEICREIVKIR